MNLSTKTFFFWSGVAVVALVGAYMAIRLLMKRERQEQAEAEQAAANRLADAPRREMGFHAIMQQEAMPA